MNPTNINQLLWSNIFTTSNAETLKQLVAATISEHKNSDIVDMLNVMLPLDLSKDKYEVIIPIIESLYINGSDIDLAPYLSVLYLKIGKPYLSKYYLGLIDNPTEEIIELIAPVLKTFETQISQKCAAVSINKHEFVRDYIFNNTQKQYSIHSFSKSIGRNATILKTPYGSIMFDCGASCSINETEVITEIEMLEFFQTIDISPDDLIAIIISHAHLDHYGSIATLFNLGIDSSKIFIENETKSLIQQVATNIPSIEHVFSVDAFFTPFQRVKISAFANGHILGSTGYIVTFDDINVIYTGDYCIHSQKTVSGLNLDKLLRHPQIVKYGVDCLITETTYGKRAAIIEYEDITKVFIHFVNSLIANGYKVFIPSFAIGRSQEIALLLNQSHTVLIDGLAAKISKIYEDVSGVRIFNSKTRYNENFDTTKEDNFDCNDIIIASSGMLTQNSTSYNYVKEFLSSTRRIAIIKTGYISSESYGNALLNEWKGQNDRLFDISLSAHADLNEICELIATLNPKHIVCVHGEGLEDNAVEIQESLENSKLDFTSSKTSDDIVSSKNNNIVSDVKIDSSETITSINPADNLIENGLDDDDDDDDQEVDSLTAETSEGTLPKYEQLVYEEILKAKDDTVVTLMKEFVDSYIATDKADRASNSPPSEKNEKVNNAYYDLYSYVRIEPQFQVFYEMLYRKGRKKRSRIVKLLNKLLQMLEENCKIPNPVVEEKPFIPEWTPSSILYVHKGTILCQRNLHNIIPATAVLTGQNNYDIKLSVNYCLDCNRFFINYISYEAYRKKYGVLIGNIVMEDENKTVFGDALLADASPLKLCGYSVNQQDNYSRETRRFIIEQIIQRGIMTKSDVIRYLEYFISMNGRKRGNEIALDKWKEDLAFTHTVEFDTQNQYHITEIKRY